MKNYVHAFIQNKIFSILVLTTFCLANAQIEHTSFTQLLQNNVSKTGFVNYQQLKNEEDKLDQYLVLLSKNIPNKSWTKNEKIAHLINMYNAYTLKLILMNYPVESIKDIGNLLSSPFTTDFIPFNGEEISLDDIEKGMLLKLNEPRVHFAINCASKSCPKLQNEAFEAEKLDMQLEAATKAFINSEQNKISKNKLQLSKIFKWYASDFEAKNQSVIDFINKYTTIKIDKNAEIDYLDYSWKLNGE